MNKQRAIELFNSNLHQFKNENPKEYKEVIDSTQYLPIKTGIKQRLWHIINGKNSPLCSCCKEVVMNWDRPKNKYRVFCRKCVVNSPQLKEKRKQTSIKNYGVPYPSQHKTEKERRTKSWKNKSKQEIRDISNKRRNTNLEKYGVENPQQSKDIQKKTQETNLKKYGFISTLQNKEIQEKTRQTNLKKYGVEHTSQNKEIYDKKRKTWEEKYGVDHPWKDAEIRNNINKTFHENYGTHPKQVHISTNSLEKMNNIDWLIEENKTKTLTEISIELGVSISSLSHRFIEKGISPKIFFTSSDEYDLFSHIKEKYNGEIIRNDRTIIAPKEIDIYLPEKNIAFEYNGVHWHSELSGIKKYYHLNKLKNCKDKGIHLVQIFSNEWNNKRKIVESRISSFINNNNKIYARKTKVDYVDINASKLFLNENHIQGYVHSNINLGLYYNNTLVALMTFGKSRFTNKFEYELLRYCTTLHNTVVGGASKLFKSFIKKYNPTSVISYSDKRWNKGFLYPKIGFSFDHSSTPNYWYFHKNKPNELYSRIFFQKHKLEKLLETFKPELTEWENMVNNGYNRIWDCGNDVFYWKC